MMGEHPHSMKYCNKDYKSEMEKDMQGQTSEQVKLDDTMGYHSGISAADTFFDIYRSNSQHMDASERNIFKTTKNITESSHCQLDSDMSLNADILSKQTDTGEEESPNPTQSSDSDEDLFECGICTEDLTTPKSLPCLHNFCLQCLEKYFTANCLGEGQSFNCPTCRASVTIPQGGAKMFPTNFHIANLRKHTRELDMGQTIKDALHYLDNRAEEIVDEMFNRKRLLLIEISKRRENLVTQIDDIVEELLELVEEQYSTDSTTSVNTISAVKEKLSELQTKLKETCLDLERKISKQTEAIQLNALTRLRRQAEIISNVNNELEELKQHADQALTNILDKQLAFCTGKCCDEDLKQLFGKLVVLTDGQTLDDVTSQERNDEGFSPLHVKSWSQSWWVLLFTITPAVIITMVVKVILTLFEKLL